MHSARSLERAGVGVVFAGAFGYLLLRAFIGVDLADSSYILAIARRMAAGDLPFRDEMSAHTLGSLPAVPFVWAWTALFGDTGLIAASRVFAAVWIAAVILLCHRALRHSLRPMPTAVGLAATTLCLPYSVLATSYNTVPMFLLLLAACAAHRAIGAYHRGWAVTGSIAATAAAISFPAVSVGSGVLLLVLAVAVRRHGASWRTVLRDIVGPWALLCVVVGSAFLVVVGVGPIQDSLALQGRMRPGIGPGALWGLLKFQLTFLTTPGKIPVAFLLALAAAASPWRRPAAVAATGSGLVLLVVAAKHPAADSIALTAGMFAGQFGLLLVLVWLPILVRASIADPEVRRMAGLGVCVLPAAAGVQLVTASGFNYGAALDGSAPLLCATCLGFAVMVCRWARFPWNVGGAIPALCALVCLNSVVFNEGPVAQPRDLVREGPAAGLWVSGSMRTSLAHMATLVDACPTDSRALVIGLPGAYLWLPPRSAAVASWLGADFVHAVPAAEQLSRNPTCVIAQVPQPGNIVGPADVAATARFTKGMSARTGVIVVSVDPIHGANAFRTYSR